MRAVVALFLATPAQAWDFTPTPVCTILADTPTLAVRVTYDPAQAEPYAITFTRSEPWPDTASFGLRFDGEAAMTIGTDRHRLSADGQSLSVSDTGFGNVLDGLALNRTAVALAGDLALPVDLAGAAEAVAAFRACGAPPLS
jgi:hypothetical protein